jgi:hypothetical protein
MAEEFESGLPLADVYAAALYDLAGDRDMKIKADEIASVIKQEIEQYSDAHRARRRRGRPRARGRRRHRPDLRPVQRDGRRDARVRQRRRGPVFNLEQNSVGAVISATTSM